MSGALPPISDEDLHGFVDGEIALDQRRDIEIFLGASPVDAERIENWRRQRDIMRAAFARVEAEPPPQGVLLPRPMRRCAFLSLLRPNPEHPAGGQPAVSPECAMWGKGDGGEVETRCAGNWRASTRRRSLAAAFAAGAVATLAAAFLTDSLHAPRGAPDWASSPVLTDDLLAERTVAALTAFRPQSGAGASAEAVADPSPAPHQNTLVVPNLSSAGLTLAGVRAAPGPAGEAFCLFYAKAPEATVALCVARGEGGGAPGFRVSSQSQPSSTRRATVISWRQENAIYALAGPLSEAKLRDLAIRVSADVAAFDPR